MTPSSSTLVAVAVALAPASLGGQAVPNGGPAAQQAVAAPTAVRYRAAADSIIDAALADSGAYRRLALLTDLFGHRLSGSASLERAIDWVLAEMQRDGLERVHGEPVMVPHWVRGAESAELVSPVRRALRMLGLGGSVATPPGGVTAPLMVVTGFDDLERRRREAAGKIVLFDVPFTSYDETVRYRTAGASAAAKAGAVASLVRSVTPVSLRTPHTGALQYDRTGPKIPHAALTVEDALLLHRLADRGVRPVVRLRMDARTLPDAPSRNIVAELRGSDRPGEVVVLGGHIDSWDVGAGAMDDGGGSIVAWEALKLLKRLGLRPRRTIRVVLWTNEENGLRGGEGYRKAHAAEIDDHVLAMESDDGVFKPSGFGVVASDSALKVLVDIGALLGRIGAGTIHAGGGAADISPLVAAGVPGAALDVADTKYFWYHHTDADTIDKLDAKEMAACVATMAVMAFVAADMTDRLPRGAVAPAR